MVFPLNIAMIITTNQPAKAKQIDVYSFQQCHFGKRLAELMRVQLGRIKPFNVPHKD